MIIACIDDQPKDGQETLFIIKNQIEKSGGTVCRIAYYPSADDFFKDWKPGRFGLILLDIFLEKESGIEIAKLIRRIDNKVPIVFCSTSNEFASESYEVQANYYLTKPITPHSVDSMISHLKLLHKDEDLLELPDHRMLPLSQFLYSEYHNHQISLFLKSGRTEKIWSSQSDFLTGALKYSYLLAVTPGTLINLREVTDLKDDSFYMSNGSIVPFSRRKKKEFENRYKDYLFSRLREV